MNKYIMHVILCIMHVIYTFTFISTSCNNSCVDLSCMLHYNNDGLVTVCVFSKGGLNFHPAPYQNAKAELIKT